MTVPLPAPRLGVVIAAKTTRGGPQIELALEVPPGQWADIILAHADDLEPVVADDEDTTLPDTHTQKGDRS